MEQQDVENIGKDIVVGFQRFLCNILLRHYITVPLFPALLIIQDLNGLFNNLERIAAMWIMTSTAGNHTAAGAGPGGGFAAAEGALLRDGGFSDGGEQRA